MGAVEAYHIEGIDAWDVAAGKLIIEEAGGIIIDTAGNYYLHTMLDFILSSSFYPKKTLTKYLKIYIYRRRT